MIRPHKMAVLLLSVHPLIEQSLLHLTLLTGLTFPLNHRAYPYLLKCLPLLQPEIFLILRTERLQHAGLLKGNICPLDGC